MPFEVATTFEFAASHKLDRLPRDHPCAELHGHTYRVTLIFRCEHLDEDGFCLEQIATNWFANYLKENFDHKHLNDVFKGISYMTTPDNMAVHFFGKAQKVYGDIVSGCRVSESPNTYSEYRKPTPF